MNAISIFKLLLTLFPLIIDAVKAVEAAVPTGGQGSIKLGMIRELLAAAYSSGGAVAQTFEDIWPAVSKTVAGVVTAFNAAGVFKRA